ncbi:hypothetical protein OHB31_16480 [Streptomyces microflavus]|uniref:CU044_2847 family protein n=1 Tax=Streptomyces microflavus TaxID=1919 RepID=UPI002DD921E5|nr:CU044_2847 family protein [Streptomyces microflavus]WSA61656.1 hypothetical protein OHB31_16480 [Streptomyces microflavus]
MSHYAELLMDDGTAIRLQLSPAGGPPGGNDSEQSRANVVPTDDAASGGHPEDGAYEEELPGGVGGAEPVGRIRDATRTLARGSLRGALSPLVPLLSEVHALVSSVDHPPQEFNVQFGLELGQDLKLGIVDVKSSSSITVSATWHTAPEAGTGTGSATAS